MADCVQIETALLGIDVDVVSVTPLVDIVDFVESYCGVPFGEVEGTHESLVLSASDNFKTSNKLKRNALTFIFFTEFDCKLIKCTHVKISSKVFAHGIFPSPMLLLFFDFSLPLKVLRTWTVTKSSKRLVRSTMVSENASATSGFNAKLDNKLNARV